MGIITKFTKANIKSAKTNSFVLIFSVAICSIIFVLSLVIPYYMRTHAVKLAKWVYGNADFYLMPNSNSQRFASTKIIPESLRNECDYIYGFFIFYNQFIVNNVSENYTVIGVDYEELNNFNPLNLTTEVKSLGDGEIIISDTIAEKWNANIGDLFVVEATGGYKYAVKVVGIGEDDSSIFSLNSPIVVSKDFMKKLSGGVFNDGMFNLLIVKLKDSTEVTEISRKFTDLYSNFSVSYVGDLENVNVIISTLTTPFFIIAAIVILFCIFIIILCCNLIFTDRLKQFATLKCMGATNKQLITSLLIESCIYGFIGGIFAIIFCVVLVSILHNIGFDYIIAVPFLYYFYMMLFAIGFSVIFSLFPAIANSRKSIRQTMIISTKSKYRNIVYITLGLLSLLCAAICNIIYIYEPYTVATLIMMFAYIIGIVLIAPYVVWLIVKAFVFIFGKLTGFAGVYTKSNLLSSPMQMVVKLMCFGFIIFFVLNSLPYIMDKGMNEYTQSLSSDLEISEIRKDIDIVVNEINNLDNVNYIMVGDHYLSKYDYLNDAPIQDLFAYRGEDIKKAFSSKINDSEALSKIIRSDKGYIVLSPGIAHVYGYEIGDLVSLKIENEYIIFEVAGVVDTMENFSKLAIVNVEYLNNYFGSEISKKIFVAIDNYSENRDVLYNQILALPSLTGAQVTDTSSMIYISVETVKEVLFLIYFYAYLVMVLSFITIAIGLLLCLKQYIQQHKIMALLGMSNKIFLKTFYFMLSFVITISVLLAYIGCQIIFAYLIDIVLYFGQYFKVTLSAPTTYLACIIAGVCALILGLIIAKSQTKAFQPKAIIEEG